MIIIIIIDISVIAFAVEKSLKSIQNERKDKQWLKTDLWALQSGLCCMPMVVFIYSNFNMYRQRNFPNGIHTADRKSSPNSSPTTSLKTRSALDEGTHEIFWFLKNALMGNSVKIAREGSNSKRRTLSYLVNWRSLASMLRCLMHILVRAEPISLVAPGNTKQPGSYDETHREIQYIQVTLYVPHKADQYLHYS